MINRNRRAAPQIAAQSLDPASVPGPRTTLADLVSYPDGRKLIRHDDTFLGRNFAMYYWLDNIALRPCDRLEAFVNGQWLRVRYVHDRDARMEEIIPRSERRPGAREPVIIPLPASALFRRPKAEVERLRQAYVREEAKKARRKDAKEQAGKGPARARGPKRISARRQ